MNHGARKGPLWTPAEDAVIRELAATTEAADIAAKLPGRTQAAVFHRMRRLGIDKRRRWTKSDDLQLADLWGGDLDAVAKKIGRTKITTYWRAQKLGLGLGCPAGCERLSKAARRCGYATSTFRMILGWAGVRIHRSVTRKRKRKCTRWVDPVDVDDAVASWCATETPNAAARRLEVAGETIVRRLLMSGLSLPPKPEGKQHWRIPSKTIDAAMAMVVKRGRHLVRISEETPGKNTSTAQVQSKEAA